MNTPNFLITASLLSLASNVKAEHYLANCQHQLANLGELIVTPVLLNDCQNTLLDVPVYHNQIGVLQFNEPMGVQDFLAMTKQLEQENERGEFAKPLVTLDVDVLAVQVVSAESGKFDNKNIDLAGFGFSPILDNWWAITRRLPLASYDKQGIEQLPMDYVKLFQKM
ncbi:MULTISPECIES: hypothetical protein [unclassified Moraxella]|uniref:hypothetical protein n=1 Tax=unclassified Moraxella TaxID=2685852 RepID=UPI003AF77875